MAELSLRRGQSGISSETLDRGAEAAGSSRDAPLFFICRSGARSASAAAAMTAAGYLALLQRRRRLRRAARRERARGTIEGWKAAKLPWVAVLNE